MPLPIERYSVPAVDCRSITLNDEQITQVANDSSLVRPLGIDLSSAWISNAAQHNATFSRTAATDAGLTPLQTTASTGTPTQFLQSWLPGMVNVITTARKIDELIGMTSQGEWYDEEIVQTVIEHTGEVSPYTDNGDLHLANYNVNYETRTIVRGELGFEVGSIEEARAAKAGVSAADQKRIATATAFEIFRNLVGFQGYNDGNNRTYGFLNEPNLPAYVTAPNGVGGNSVWSTKTYLERQADITAIMNLLASQSGSNIDPFQDAVVLAITTSNKGFMAETTAEKSQSLIEWFHKTYAGGRIVTVPEFVGANGGEDIMYAYAESVKDSGTDDNRTWIQVVPSKITSLGVEQKAKTYIEAHTNATAGVMLKRSFAVARYTGV